MTMRRYLLIVLVGAVLIFAGGVEAHAGGVMQVASEDAGPFKLTVWTSPEPAQVGEVHVAAAVASAEDALPILDAEVFIEMTPQSGQGAVLNGRATTEASTNQFLYETIFEVPVEGLYQVTVTTTGTDGGQGTVSFDLVVKEAPPLILGAVGLVLLGVITGGAVWFYLNSTSGRAKSEGLDEFDAVSG